MPSLFRFLTVVAVIGGHRLWRDFRAGEFVNPKPREMSVTIPQTSSSRNRRWS